MCLSNNGYAASLEPSKIYIALRDAAAERNGLLRVVDESARDLAPAFGPRLPQLGRRAVDSRSSDGRCTALRALARRGDLQ